MLPIGAGFNGNPNGCLDTKQVIGVGQRPETEGVVLTADGVNAIDLLAAGTEIQEAPQGIVARRFVLINHAGYAVRQSLEPIAHLL